MASFHSCIFCHLMNFPVVRQAVALSQGDAVALGVESHVSRTLAAVHALVLALSGLDEAAVEAGEAAGRAADVVLLADRAYKS